MITDTDEQQYPEGEEQDPDGESIPMDFTYNGFGLTAAARYHFVSQRTGKELRAFLKNRRIPYHTKYAKQLEAVYASLQDQA